MLDRDFVMFPRRAQPGAVSSNRRVNGVSRSRSLRRSTCAMEYTSSWDVPDRYGRGDEQATFNETMMTAGKYC